MCEAEILQGSAGKGHICLLKHTKYMNSRLEIKIKCNFKTIHENGKFFILKDMSCVKNQFYCRLFFLKKLEKNQNIKNQNIKANNKITRA